MKIRVKRMFRYQASPTRVKTINPGIHDLPEELARKVLRFGKAEIIVSKPVEKKAPENKVVEVTESKKKVARKPLRRSRPRTKTDE